MKRFEAPYTNLSHDDRLSGLNLQAIRIAESAALQRSINDFMLVAVDRPSFAADGHIFNHRRISALGCRGTLLSVYMQQAPDATLPIEQSHVLLTANTESPIPDAWATTLVRQQYGSSMTELVVGDLESDTQQHQYDAGMSREQREDEALRDRLWREEEWQSFPKVRFGTGPWEYEQDSAVERLSDLTLVSGRVRLAVTRGFGAAVFKRFDPERYLKPDLRRDAINTGQKEEKMVA